MATECRAHRLHHLAQIAAGQHRTVTTLADAGASRSGRSGRSGPTAAAWIGLSGGTLIPFRLLLRLSLLALHSSRVSSNCLRVRLHPRRCLVALVANLVRVALVVRVVGVELGEI